MKLLYLLDMDAKAVVLILICSLLVTVSYAQDNLDLLIMNRNYEDALQLIDNQIEVGESASLYLRKGKILSSVHDYQQAVDAYSKGLQLEPDNHEVLTELADAYAALGNYHDAGSFYEKACSMDPDNLLVAGKLGRNFIQLNDYKRAYNVFADVYLADSTKIFWNKQLAYCAYKTDRKQEAIDLFERVIEMNPGDYSSYMNLIKLYQQTEQDIKKLKVIEEGLGMFPGDAGLIQARASHLFSIRQYKAARHAYEEFWKAGGDSAYRMLLNYGVSLYFSGNEEQAITVLDVCTDQVVNDPYVLFYLGLSYKKLIKYEMAEAYMKAAIESATPAYLPDMYHHLGQIYGQQRAFKESLTALKEANELDPSNYEVLFEIATTYEEFNSNKTLALNYYNIYLKEAGESARNADYALERMSKIKEELFFED